MSTGDIPKEPRMIVPFCIKSQLILGMQQDQCQLNTTHAIDISELWQIFEVFQIEME